MWFNIRKEDLIQRRNEQSFVLWLYFFEVSAKTKYNIKNIFNVLTTNIYEKFEYNLALENYENTTYDHKKEFEENLNIRCC